MDNDLHCQFGIEANFPGSREAVWHEDMSGTRYNVYRSEPAITPPVVFALPRTFSYSTSVDNFDKGGREVCKVLEESFDGPSCGATPEEAWETACATIKLIPGFDAKAFSTGNPGLPSISREHSDKKLCDQATCKCTPPP
jgi:hypothetical protein